LSTPQRIEKLPIRKYGHIPCLAAAGLQADAEITLELVFFGQGFQRLQIRCRDIFLRFDFPRGMVADDEVDLKAGSGAPVAQGVPGNIVRLAGQLGHDVGFEGFAEFRRARSELPFL